MSKRGRYEPNETHIGLGIAFYNLDHLEMGCGEGVGLAVIRQRHVAGRKNDVPAVPNRHLRVQNATFLTLLLQPLRTSRRQDDKYVKVRGQDQILFPSLTSRRCELNLALLHSNSLSPPFSSPPVNSTGGRLSQHFRGYRYCILYTISFLFIRKCN